MDKLTVDRIPEILERLKAESGMDITCDGVCIYDLIKQLADTMRENERLREALEKISEGLHPDINGYEERWADEYYKIARESLQPYKDLGQTFAIDHDAKFTIPVRDEAVPVAIIDWTNPRAKASNKDSDNG